MVWFENNRHKGPETYLQNCRASFRQYCIDTESYCRLALSVPAVNGSWLKIFSWLKQKDIASLVQSVMIGPVILITI